MSEKPIDKFEVIYHKGKVNRWVRSCFDRDLIKDREFKNDFILASQGDTLADLEFKIKLIAKKQSYSTEYYCRCRSLLVERIQQKNWRDEESLD